MARKLVNQEIVGQVRAVYRRDNVCLTSGQRFQFLKDGPVVLFHIKAASLACRGIYNDCVISAELFDPAPGTEQIMGHRLD